MSARSISQGYNNPHKQTINNSAVIPVSYSSNLEQIMNIYLGPDQWS